VRKLLVLTVVPVLLWAAPSAGNPYAITPGGAIDLYRDNAGMLELIIDASPALLPIYVVHTMEPFGGAAACQFSAPKPACFTGMYLSDTNPFPVTIGNSQTGVSIGYGSCRQYPIHVLTMSFFGQGTTSCCFYPVLPDPNEPSGQVVAVDCSQQLVPVKGGATVINYTSGCYSVPAEETSWGRVKSLYGE
jgi:hypothetical protein